MRTHYANMLSERGNNYNRPYYLPASVKNFKTWIMFLLKCFGKRRTAGAGTTLLLSLLALSAFNVGLFICLLHLLDVPQISQQVLSMLTTGTADGSSVVRRVPSSPFLVTRYTNDRHQQRVYHNGGSSSPNIMLQGMYRNSETYHIGDKNITLISRNQQLHCPPGTEIFIAVNSAPNNFERRQILRRSWIGSNFQGHLEIRRIFAVFVLGMPSISNETLVNLLLNEHKQHSDDMLLSSTLDDYKTVTYKVILGYAWALQHCPSVKFLVKVDDDTFVNTIRLPAYLNNAAGVRSQDLRSHERRSSRYKSSDFVVMGPMNFNLYVVRDPKSKWYVSSRMYADSLYPEYAAGIFYGVTSSFATAVVEKTVGDMLLPVDDAFITGILAGQLGATKVLTPLHDAKGRSTFVLGNVEALERWMATDLDSSASSIQEAPVAFGAFYGLLFDAVVTKMKLKALSDYLKTRTFNMSWTDVLAGAG